MQVVNKLTNRAYMLEQTSDGTVLLLCYMEDMRTPAHMRCNCSHVFQHPAFSYNEVVGVLLAELLYTTETPEKSCVVLKCGENVVAYDAACRAYDVYDNKQGLVSSRSLAQAMVVTMGLYEQSAENNLRERYVSYFGEPAQAFSVGKDYAAYTGVMNMEAPDSFFAVHPEIMCGVVVGHAMIRVEESPIAGDTAIARFDLNTLRFGAPTREFPYYYNESGYTDLPAAARAFARSAFLPKSKTAIDNMPHEIVMASNTVLNLHSDETVTVRLVQVKPSGVFRVYVRSGLLSDGTDYADFYTYSVAFKRMTRESYLAAIAE